MKRFRGDLRLQLPRVPNSDQTCFRRGVDELAVRAGHDGEPRADLGQGGDGAGPQQCLPRAHEAHCNQVPFHTRGRRTGRRRLGIPEDGGHARGSLHEADEPRASRASPGFVRIAPALRGCVEGCETRRGLRERGVEGRGVQSARIAWRERLGAGVW